LETNLRCLFLYNRSADTPEAVSILIRDIHALPSMQVLGLNLAHFDIRDLAKYAKTESVDVVLIHNTASYFAAYLESVLIVLRSMSLEIPIAVMKQDEHLEPHLFDKLFHRHSIELVFSCVSDQDLAHVYPESVNSKTRFRKTYAAYVSSIEEKAEYKALPSTKVLSYRGSIQPVQLGKLGFDKVLMPERAFRALHARKGDWILDLSSSWTERLYGDAWIDFLDLSYAVLSSESGSNVFDLTGSLRKKTEAFESKNGPVSWNDGLLLIRYYDEILAPFEGNVNYGTFGPRHLEVALRNRPQVLIRGYYSGLFVDEKNCLMVDSSLEQLPEILDKLSNVKFAMELAKQARMDVLDFAGIRTADLISQIDHELCTLTNSSQKTLSRQSSCSQNTGDTWLESALILCAVPHFKDPRHEWWIDTCDMLFNSTEVWSYIPSGQNCYWPIPSVTRLGAPTIVEGEYRLNVILVESHVPWSRETEGACDNWCSESQDWEAVAIVSWMLQATKNPKGVISNYLAKQFLTNFLATLALAKTVRPQLIIANDLMTGFAAAIIWKDSSSKVLYDAQEVFTRQYDQGDLVMFNGERVAWNGVEQFVVGRSDLVVTVSEGIREYMNKHFGMNIQVVPNFPPRQSGSSPARERTLSGNTRFIYMGNAAPGRGLEKLLEHWPLSESEGELHLYIPESPALVALRYWFKEHKEFHRSNIYWHTAVAEHDMIPTLQDFDVGVIPYDYSYPYNYCSPNKLGQYMAAGLAILSNYQPFIVTTIQNYDCGLVFNWRDTYSFESACRKMLDVKILLEFQSKSIEGHSASANWESYVLPLMEELMVTTKDSTDEDRGQQFSPYRLYKRSRLAATTEMARDRGMVRSKVFSQIEIRYELPSGSHKSSRKFNNLKMMLMESNLRDLYLLTKDIPVIGSSVQKLKTILWKWLN